jgi:hypothetical protein
MMAMVSVLSEDTGEGLFGSPCTNLVNRIGSVDETRFLCCMFIILLSSNSGPSSLD